MTNKILLRFFIIFSTPMGFIFSQTMQYQLTPSDPYAFSRFGDAVSISGSKVIIGAWGVDSGTGAAYTYEYDGESWSQIQKITGEDGEFGGNFGTSVSISGNTAVAGAPRENWDTGAVYLFDYNGSGWSQTQKVVAGDGVNYSYFGNSVDISGTTVIIGSWKNNEDGGASGAAYIYQISDGTSQKISASDGYNGRNFGNAVAISEVGSCIVGCWHDGPLGDNSGSAYIFEYIGEEWVETAKLIPSDGAAFDEFGTSVDISGSTAIVGSPEHGTNLGAAYIFEYIDTSWVEVQKLLPSHGSDLFGNSVAIDGNIAVVGDLGGDGMLTSTGCAYVYEYDGENWQEIEFIISGSDDPYLDVFGKSVAISGTYVLAGEPGYDSDISNSGAAYVNHLTEPIPGCTDPLACNYEPEANENDGSCIYPETEICDDGLDNDCDGNTDLSDDECICIPGSTQVCGYSETGECQFGEQTCIDGYFWSTCNGNIEPVSEICDGLDNDCDGEEDNGFNIGEACDNNQSGVCFETGVYICDGPDATTCNAPDGSGNAENEICDDGLDNDCDGNTDLEDVDCPAGEYIFVPEDYTTIQAAIDASVDGMTIIVAPGTYLENINFNGKNIVLSSEYILTEDPASIDLTVIDGDNAGRTVTINNGEDSALLIGFSIVNGLASIDGTVGGGILIYGSDPEISYCNIYDNTADNYGGGLSISGGSNPTLSHLNIYNNHANNAGGINCYQSTGNLNNILLYGNTANFTGGGMLLKNCGDVSINKSTMSGNTAANGGSLFMANSSATLSNTILW